MACVGDSILTEYNGSNDDATNCGTSSATLGQSFQIPNDAEVCAMSIFGGQGTVGARGTLKIELFSGSITGTLEATTGSFPDSDFNCVFTTPCWTKFEFTTPVSLTGGVTYWIRATALTGSINDVFRWATDVTSPTYPDGSRYNGTVINTGADGLFRIHGVEGGGGGYRFNPQIKPFAGL